MQPVKMDHANEGIKCVVNSCYYYMSGDKCTAEKIEVQPKDAHSTEDTDCATFVPENTVSS